MAAAGYTPAILFNSVTTGNAPSSLVQGETAWNITDKKLWVGNAAGTPIQLIGAGASMTLASLTVTNDASISGLTVGKGGGASTTNTVVGVTAGAANTTGAGLAAFGDRASFSNTTGTANTSVGGLSLYTNSTGGYNTSVGNAALFSNTTGSNNTAVGYQAAYNYAGAGGVTSLGYQAGSNLTTGFNSIFIGSGSQPSANSDTGQIVIGTLNVTGKGSNTGFISPNGGGVYQGNNSTLWSITSDQRLKKNIVDNFDGLNKITAIQVRNFEYRSADEVTELEPQNAIDIKGVQLGAIAQELQAILPDCVKTESTGVMSVDASNLTWYLINAVKELNAKVEAQALEIAALKGK